MNKKRIIRIACVIAALMTLAGAASAAESTYVSTRAGIFLPNGTDGGNYKGFKYFDTGFNFELAAGYRPVPYAAFELGTGFYNASATITQATFTIDRTAYGVPITLTVKGIYELEKLMLSAGAGVGYYQGFMTNKINVTGSTPIDESNHGGALGYQVVFDADFKLNKDWALGANFKWFTAKPEIELKDPTGIASKDKWEFGGTVINVGVKYMF